MTDKLQVGDLLKDKWNDTLWLIIGMSETCSKAPSRDYNSSL
jgi:hypothetical protein